MVTDGIQFGVCTPVEFAAAAKPAGWDFVEVVVGDLLEPAAPDSTWRGLERLRAGGMPVPAANRLVPEHLKITGPAVAPYQLQAHMTTVARRAAAIGIRILVFGSGAARNVPAGFSREQAREQIIDFCRMAADACAAHGITLVAEPLNRGECNIINSVAEAMTYVEAVSHPSFLCLVDSFHLWLEHEPLENVGRAMPWIRHVHLADVAGRSAPGDTGADDYRPLFSVLKRGGYRGMITVESTDLESTPDGARHVLNFLKGQWSDANN